MFHQNFPHNNKENMKPEFDLHIQKSFSFTAFSKFKDSTLEFFSDNDENDIDTHKNDDNSFIEISLDHHHHQNPNNVVNNNNNIFDNHLRISFSSSFPSIPDPSQPQDPNPKKPVQSSSSSPSSSSSSIRLSASSLRSFSTGGTSRGPALTAESFNQYESSRRRDQLPAFNPLVHTLLFSLQTHPSPVPETVDLGRSELNGCDRRIQLGIINPNYNYNAASNNIHRHRKASNVTTTTTTSCTTGNQNGIMNKLLMIKFGVTKVKKLISSLFTKSKGQVNMCNSYQVENDISHGYTTKRQHNISKEYGNHHVASTNDIKNSHYKPRALDVNLGAVRGVLEAVNMRGKARNGRTNRRKTSSCPSSIKSSPLHQGFGGDCSNNGTFFGGENSIQAAIAHCKSSLGQTTEFRL